MAVINTVLPQEDELLISLIHRTAEKNGIDIDYFLKEYLFDDKHESMPSNRELESFTASNCYVAKFADAVNKDKLGLFLDTGIYPGIAPFLPSYVQSRRINAAFIGFDLYPRLIGRIHNDIPILKYCPMCVKEDGIPYLHKSHHMPNVSSCHKHGVDLINVENFLQNGIPDNCVQTKKSDETAVCYAQFVESLLKTPIDANWWMIREPLICHIDAALIDRCTTPEYERLFGMDSATFFSVLKKKNLHIGIGTILAGLFAIYKDPKNIEAAPDEGLMERFLEASKAYNIIGTYSHTAVEMVPRKGGIPFITTPWGFLAGWREHSGDVPDEDRKFRQIVRNITGGEIRPAEPFKGYFYSMDFVQRGTGNIFHPKAESVIEGIQTYEGKRRNRISESDVRRIVEASGEYRLDDFTGVKRPLTITCLSCGHTFTVSYDAWKKHQKCRVCLENDRKKNLVYYASGKKYDGDNYDPTAVFIEKMKAIVGTEYSLVGEYKDIHTPTAIRHEKCGHVFSMTPNVFLNGGRCPRCRLPLADDFRNYICIRSNGQYEFVSRAGSFYTIVDTYTGKEYTLKKQIIIREFERPDNSEILPVLAKTGFRRSKTNIEIFTDYLACHMRDQDLFTKREIAVEGLTSDQVHKCIQKSLKKKLIERVNRGTYRYLGGSYVA